MIYVKLLYAGQVEGHDVVLSKTSANKIYKVGQTKATASFFEVGDVCGNV
jgi:hypothetical protein